MTVEADVIVVGSGPAGCAAACHLARSGVDVALLDRASFPREKVCGDALSPEALEALRELGMDGALDRAHLVDGSYVFAPDGHSMVTRCDHPGALLPRKDLDAMLLQQARGAGARFFPGRAFARLVRRPDRMIVRTGDEEGFCGRCVVLATGSNAAALKAAGVLRGTGGPSALGVRAYFENVDCPQDKIVHSFDRFLLPGYGWIFPFGNGLANVGVAAHRRWQGRFRLRRKFERFTCDSPAARRFLGRARQVSPAGTGPLRLDLRGAALLADRLLVVGDAAGAGAPANGEGTAPALVTGRLAARTIRRALRRGDLSPGALRPYGRAVRRAYEGRYSRARWFRRLLVFPTTMNLVTRWGATDPRLADRLAWVLTGKLTPLSLPWRRILRPRAATSPQ